MKEERQADRQRASWPHIRQGFGYYDYQWSKVRRTFGDQVLMFNLCCCDGQLAPFPVATCRPLTSLGAKRAKLQATILLPL